MSNIDDRIVAMKFDNEQFEKRLADTIVSLDKLTAAIESTAKTTAFDNLALSANSFNTESMGRSIDSISDKLSAMGAIGFSVISNLTDTILDFAKRTTGDIIGPILTGGTSRAKNIEQAKFQFRGLGIDVDTAMQSALDAVLGTAFGLDEAAKAGAQFGASGIQAGKDMTDALRGVAGAAALTGSSFSEIADIFAGSAGTGIVNNQDLQQFGTRGLNAAAAVAKVMGKTEAEIHQMAADGKLDFKTFAQAMNEAFGQHATEANQTYTGSLANLHAAMSRLGASFVGPKMEQLRDIFNATTPVVDNINKALQPLFQTVLQFGQIGTFKLVSFLGNLDLSNFRAAVLLFTAGLQNIHSAFEQFVQPLKDAFRQVFPKSAVSPLVKIAEAFKNITDTFRTGPENIGKVTRIFQGIFSVISIGITIVKEAAKFFGGLIGEIVKATHISGKGGGVLEFFGHLADTLNVLKIQLVDLGGIHKFFENVGSAIKSPLDAIIKFKDTVAGLFEGLFGDASPGGVAIQGTETSLGRLGQRLDELKGFISNLVDAWHGMSGEFTAITDVLSTIFDYMKTWFGELGSKLQAAFQPGDFDAVVDIINVGLLGGIVLLLKKFLKDGVPILGDIKDKIRGALDQLTGTLSAMQQELKAKALLEIAKAVGILTISIVALSLIDSAALTKSLTAITVGFVQLGAMLVFMDRMIGGKDAAVKLGILGVALIEISTAMVIFSGAIAILSRLNIAEIGKGLVGVGGGISILAGATYIFGREGSLRLVAAGVGMVALAIGLEAMSVAVKSFSGIAWSDIGHGLSAIAATLFVITIAMSSMPLNLPVTAAGIAILGGALVVLAQGVKSFGSLDWGVIGKGLVGLAGALILITVAMDAMPLTLPITAAGLVVLGGALLVIADAVERFGNMDWSVIGKGLLGLAGVLLILGAAMEVMETAIPGAAALVIVSGALVVLAGVLDKIGNMETDNLIRGLSGIASVLAIIGIAGFVIGPVVPVLIGLGVALGILGGAMFLFGAGAYFVARAMEIMAKSGVEGTKSLIEAINIFITALPDFFTALIKTIIDNLEEFLKAIPLLTRILQAVLEQILDTIIKLAPKAAEAFVEVVKAIFKVLRTYYPELIQTGLELLVTLLQGIRDNIGEVTTLVAEIVVNFLDALSEKVPDMVDAIVNFWITVLTTVVEKLGETIPTLTPKLAIAFITGLLKGFGEAIDPLFTFFTELPGKLLSLFAIQDLPGQIRQIGTDILTGLLNGLIEGVQAVFQWFIDLPGQILDYVKTGLGINSPSTEFFQIGLDILAGLLQGLWDGVVDVMNWFIGLPAAIINWIGDVTGKLKDVGVALIGGIFTGITDKIGEVKDWFLKLKDLILGWIPNPISWLADVGKNIVQGLIGGIESMTDALGITGNDLKSTVEDPIKKGLKISSPSKVFFEYGVNVGQGLLNGLVKMQEPVKKASETFAEHITNAMSTVSDSLQDITDFQPTIAPVVDLTDVISAGKKIGGLIGSDPSINFDSTFQKALLAEQSAQLVGAVGVPVAEAPRDVTFIQNNHSPEALGVNDIYRNTKSQLALAKEELGIP